MKVQDVKWLDAGNVRLEAVITGEIKSIAEEKQHFFYHRYIYVQTLKLQTATRLITAKMVHPVTKNVKIDTFTIGESIRAYGSWEGSTFLINHFEMEKR